MEIYILNCPNCRTVFEVTEEEKGLPPFNTECPNCGGDRGVGVHRGGTERPHTQLAEGVLPEMRGMRYRRRGRS